ncbi:uncharacterized protein LOC133925859 [Phragmites australis]|uniref:uncharacterized protein LOC133925859 n=1 Tax=Phragmites australis TaxID=29695 RepID=UPI002D7927CF|nr:uncharacterized protein LOC133925859 [Phragmites australis]
MSDDRQAVLGREETLEVPVDSDGGMTAERKEWLKEMRGWLIVLATLAASVTYQAGLNPPGGFWQDDKNQHVPGNPVLHDGRLVKRYLTFYYFNATAFATSLVIIILLLNERFYKSEAKVAALTLTTMVDLMSLVGAYIAGSTRDMPNSIYIIVLTCFLFVVVIYIARVLPNLCFIVLFTAPPLFLLANKGWLPVTSHMKKRVERAKKREQEEAEKQRAEDKANARKKWCHCAYACCPCGRAFKYDMEETGQGAA